MSFPGLSSCKLGAGRRGREDPGVALVQSKLAGFRVATPGRGGGNPRERGGDTRRLSWLRLDSILKRRSFPGYARYIQCSTEMLFGAAMLEE